MIKPALIGIVLAITIGIVLWSGMIPFEITITIHGLLLAIIGAIYIGFAFNDGRLGITVLEIAVSIVFFALAFLGMLISPYILAAGFLAHGFWDLAHHPKVVTTKVPRWYIPFCAVYDFIHASFFLLLGLISKGTI